MNDHREWFEVIEDEADDWCKRNVGDDFFDQCYHERVEANCAKERKRMADTIIERAAAAVCFLDASNADKKTRAYAFLSVFHPEMTHAEKRDFVRGIEGR